MEIDEALVERLAKAVHEEYLREQLHDGVARGSTPGLVEWSSLNDDLKEANRAQARDIAAKLAAVGCRVSARARRTFTFTARELDRLSRQEHQRWMEQRTAAGWVPGDVRDDRKKVHPSLVPWEQLSEAEKDKDRDAVRNIPSVLATAGLGVTRRRS